MTVCEEITCPENCTDVLPIPRFKLCNPEFSFGQISDVYVTNVGFPLTDETSAAEWAGRLEMPDANPAKIIHLVVIGDKPAAEVTSIDVSHGRKAYGNKKHMINATIDEVTDENYEFMRKTECGKQVLLWYKLLNGKAYGGAAGIEATMNFGHVIPQSAQELENLPGTFNWESKISPCRFDHPLQGDNSDLES
jgi:hypothetical protein